MSETSKYAQLTKVLLTAKEGKDIMYDLEALETLKFPTDLRYFKEIPDVKNKIEFTIAVCQKLVKYKLLIEAKHINQLYKIRNKKQCPMYKTRSKERCTNVSANGLYCYKHKAAYLKLNPS